MMGSGAADAGGSAAPADAGGSSPSDAALSIGHCKVPAQILDLTNWKETLPVGSAGSPTEVRQPALATFSTSPWFMPNAACDAVVFRAAVNGVTTGGSHYPRSELREMTSNGTADASWSMSAGIHTMTIDEAITQLPALKPHVVAGQIHDAQNDITVFRLEGSNLYMTNGNNTHYFLITNSYKLGTRFTATFVASGGQIKSYYNGVYQATVPSTASGVYFKAGAYTQANCTNSSPCSDSNYGEVQIYKVTVTHQ
jgi:hypothetical protein